MQKCVFVYPDPSPYQAPYLDCLLLLPGRHLHRALREQRKKRELVGTPTSIFSINFYKLTNNQTSILFSEILPGG